MDSLSLLGIPALALLLAGYLVLDTRRIARRNERSDHPAE
jgi:cell shape-determining protein MreD